MKAVFAGAALFVCALGCVPGIAGAQSCGSLAASVDDARKLLLRAANEPAFGAAKNRALRAKNALDDAAVSSMDCQCKGAYSEFDTAALRARRARDADSPNEYIESLEAAIRAFNSAIGELKSCAAQRARQGDFN
ncbi:MAG: hypothetical protein ACJ8G4_17570 [Burkholderiales bacterium]